jgi:integrase
VALNEATRRGLIARNPCAGVPALPVERQELDYLRLDEIEPYLAACRSHYRPLAHCLVGTGARISEALALQFRHLALDDGVVRIYRQRAREGDGSQATKG